LSSVIAVERWSSEGSSASGHYHMLGSKHHDLTFQIFYRRPVEYLDETYSYDYQRYLVALYPHEDACSRRIKETKKNVNLVEGSHLEKKEYQDKSLFQYSRWRDHNESKVQVTGRRWSSASII
jgi:hypothetical protein